MGWPEESTRGWGTDVEGTTGRALLAGSLRPGQQPLVETLLVTEEEEEEVAEEVVEEVVEEEYEDDFEEYESDFEEDTPPLRRQVCKPVPRPTVSPPQFLTYLWGTRMSPGGGRQTCLNPGSPRSREISTKVGVDSALRNML